MLLLIIVLPLLIKLSTVNTRRSLRWRPCDSHVISNTCMPPTAT